MNDDDDFSGEVSPRQPRRAWTAKEREGVALLAGIACLLVAGVIKLGLPWWVVPAGLAVAVAPAAIIMLKRIL